MITVFGATGYTGALVAAELARRQANFAIAGRDAVKLSALGQRLGGVAELRLANVTDRASLDRMCAASSVVVNCAGPFLKLGRPVVEAAIKGRAHYLDTTGEQLFMKEILALDPRARERGKAVVSAVATEFVPTDCLAAVAAAGVERVLTVDTLAFLSFKPSVGTAKSALGMLALDGFSYVGGEWVKERIGGSLRAFELPGIGTVTGLSYPGGDVVTIPRHVGGVRVRAYLTFPSTPGWMVRLASPLARALPWVVRSPAGDCIEKRLGSRGTEGPSDEERKTDSFCFGVHLTGRSGRKRVERVGVITGGDVYGTTAVAAAHGAILMSAEDYAPSGVLAPAQAFDPQAFLEYLKGFGVEWKMVAPGED